MSAWILLAAAAAGFGGGWLAKHYRVRGTLYERDLFQLAADTRAQAAAALTRTVELLERSRRRLIENPDIAFKAHWRLKRAA